MFFFSFDQNEKTKNVCLCLLTWNKKKSNKPFLFFCLFFCCSQLFGFAQSGRKKTFPSPVANAFCLTSKNALLKGMLNFFWEFILLFSLRCLLKDKIRVSNWVVLQKTTFCWKRKCWQKNQKKLAQHLQKNSSLLPTCPRQLPKSEKNSTFA